MSELCGIDGCEFYAAHRPEHASAPPATEPGADAALPEKPPVKWATIRQDASERGLYAVVDESMIGRKLAPTRRRLIVGNIVMAVAKWRETFRDCGCWKTAEGYALCQWHERMLQSQVAPLRVALARPTPEPLDVEVLAEATAAIDLDLPPSNDRERTYWRTSKEQLGHARAIVREYARLTTEDPDQ